MLIIGNLVQLSFSLILFIVGIGLVFFGLLFIFKFVFSQIGS